MKKLLKSTLLLLMVSAFALCSFSCAVSRRFNLTTEGTTDYKIVIAKDAMVSVQTAANELSSYLGKISGASFQIVTDDTAASSHEILVGQTNRGLFGADYEKLGEEGFAISTDGTTLSIGGGKRGAIYGVYKFLENYLGCGFYAEDCEVVPSMPTIELEKNIFDEQMPTFNLRSCWLDYYNDSSDAFRMKMGLTPKTEEFGSNMDKWARAKDLDRWSSSQFHTINYFLGKKHTYNQQPCVSDETNYQTILKAALKWIEDVPGAKYIGVSQNDGGGGWCECEKCTELNNLYGEGKPHGSWWYFVNRLANDLTAVYPDIEIYTLAYEDTVYKPVNLEMNKNVSTCVQINRTCITHSLGQCEENTNTAFTKALDDWKDYVSKFYIYDYEGCWAEFNMMFPNLYTMRGDYRFFADTGAQSAELWSTTKNVADFSALRFYLYSRLVWNPYMTAEEYQTLIDNFCKAYYGDGGSYVSEYIAYMHAYFADQHVDGNYLWRGTTLIKSYPPKPLASSDFDYSGIDFSDPNFSWDKVMGLSRYFDTSLFDVGNSLFDKALAEAKTEEQKARIKRNRIQLDYYYFYILNSASARFSIYLSKCPNINKTQKALANSAFSKYYTATNLQLWEKLRAAGITDITEGKEVPEKPNLSFPPIEWNK